MRKAIALLTILATVLFYAFAVAAPASADPGGNNGDVKIHATGTAPEDHRNEPHVCNFYIDGFNFDGHSSGTWRIERWAPTGSGLQTQGNWGPADGSGNWASSAMTLPDGHYKLFFKQTAPMAPGGEKQKVFWVECGATGPTGSTGTTGGTGASGNTGGTESGGTGTSENGGTTFGPNGIVIFTPGSSGSSGAPGGSSGAVRGFESAPGSEVGAVSPIVELPGGSNQQSPNAALGVETSPVAGVQGLPSTSTESAPAIPLAALGVAMIGLGGALLRRRDTRI